MSEDEKVEIATAAVLQRMKGGPWPFTHHDLYRAGNLAVGDTVMRAGGFAYRIADRLIQRERRAGRVEQHQRGKWFLTTPARNTSQIGEG